MFLAVGAFVAAAGLAVTDILHTPVGRLETTTEYVRSSPSPLKSGHEGFVFSFGGGVMTFFLTSRAETSLPACPSWLLRAYLLRLHPRRARCPRPTPPPFLLVSSSPS